jgi:hypothetical protein
VTSVRVAGIAETPAARARPASGLPRGTWLVTFVVLSSLLLFLATGQPLFGLAPVVGAVAVRLVLRVPVRWILFTSMSLVAIADILPVDPRFDDGRVWYPPTVILYPLLIDNLKKITGIDALRFSGMELLILLCALLALMRGLTGITVDRAGSERPARAIYLPLALSFASVLWMEVWGIGRGGDFRQSLWQMRYMLWFPVIAALAMYSLRGMRDFRKLLWVVTFTGAVKVAIGLLFYLTAARAANVKPPTVTSHADSVLWMVIIAVWFAAMIARPTRDRIVPGLLVCGWIFIGVVINNRRTAYLTLAMLLLVLFSVAGTRAKRRVMRVGIFLAPFFALYLAASTRKTTGIFAPGASLMSVVTQKDASSGTRDIENYNLIVTLKTSKLLGRGWGHEYIEAVRAFDISEVFAQYRYVAHNSVLWLWSIGGLVGFTVLFMPIGVGVFLARRAHLHARTADERLAAYASLAVITAFLIQAWADMGVLSWATMSMLACALAIAAKLAVATGAWPAPVARPTTSGRLPL